MEIRSLLHTSNSNIPKENTLNKVAYLKIKDCFLISIYRILAKNVKTEIFYLIQFSL